MKKAGTEKRESEKGPRLSFSDLSMDAFSVSEIAKWEETAMSGAAYFAKVFGTKRGAAQAVKDIRAFIDDQHQKDQLRWLAYFLTRYLGHDAKREMRLAIGKTDPELLAKLIQLGFMEASV